MYAANKDKDIEQCLAPTMNALALPYILMA